MRAGIDNLFSRIVSGVKVTDFKDGGIGIFFNGGSTRVKAQNTAGIIVSQVNAALCQEGIGISRFSGGQKFIHSVLNAAVRGASPDSLIEHSGRKGSVGIIRTVRNVTVLIESPHKFLDNFKLCHKNQSSVKNVNLFSTYYFILNISEKIII